MRHLLLTAIFWLSGIMPAQAGFMQNALAPAGAQARHILILWHLTLIVCTLVFIAVLGGLLLALQRSVRARSHAGRGPILTAHDEPGLRRRVVLATGVSVVLLFVLLVADVMADRALSRLPLSNALHIELTAHQWWWEARYDDAQASRIFITANELHIPVGRPVIITLKSGDVIHSLWVPNLHGKKDLIPGRIARIELQADMPGVYRSQCAEFCGHEHALMALLMIAEAPPQYEAWAALQRQPAPAPADEQQRRGQLVFLGGSCAMCHSIGGTTASATLGPDLTHLAGRSTIAAGTLPNGRNTLAAWILDPHLSKPGVAMPANRLAAQELEALLAYLGTLR